MQLSDIVYEVLRESRDDLLPLEVQDLIRNACSYRSFLKLIREEQNQRGPSPEEILLIESANNFRGFFQKYMSGAFGDRYSPPEEVWYEGVVRVRYEGMLDNIPVFLETLPYKQYQQGQIPKRIQHAIAARTHLLGTDMAYVVIMDQNTQGWNAWQLTGDFNVVGELALQDVGYLKSLAEGIADSMGIRTECEACPYEQVCDVDNHMSSVQSFPRVAYRTTHDSELIKELEKYLWGLNKKSTGRKTHVIHPSELTTSKCDRAIAYGLQGVAERRSIEPGLRRIFDMGHAAHDLVQMAIKYHLGDEAILEARCTHEHLKISGSCDIALEDDAVEIKTMSFKGHDKLNKQKPEHEDQDTIYATALEKDHLRFLYINKNSGVIKEFRKKVSRQRWHKLATRASRIVKAVGEGVLPEQIDKPYICNKCKYAWHCKPEITGNNRKFRR